jgi:hypothetical protein
VYNPEVFGFPSGPKADWKTSDWNAVRASADSNKISFINELIRNHATVHEMIKAGFHTGLVNFPNKFPSINLDFDTTDKTEKINSSPKTPEPNDQRVSKETSPAVDIPNPTETESTSTPNVLPKAEDFSNKTENRNSNPITSISEGMSDKDVKKVLGPPDDTNEYLTGKNWIPYYYGTDTSRIEWFYKRKGKVVFSRNRYSGTLKVIKVESNPNVLD